MDVSRLLVAWRGPGAVLLNADWWADDWLPEDHAAFVKAFEAIYSFVPLEVKVGTVHCSFSMESCRGRASVCGAAGVCYLCEIP